MDKPANWFAVEKMWEKHLEKKKFKKKDLHLY